MDSIEHIWLLIIYIILGFIPEFTESLPISSIGHLVIFRELFQINIQGLSFEIIVNIVSLIAVLIVYRTDLARLIKNGTRHLISKQPETRADFQFIVYLFVRSEERRVGT